MIPMIQITMRLIWRIAVLPISAKQVPSNVGPVFNLRSSTWWIPLAFGWALSASVLAQPDGVIVANVTPTSFSAFWLSEPGASPDIQVYMDASGTSNVTDLLRVEIFPLRAGRPSIASEYERRAEKARLAAKCRDHGIQYVRVTGCKPGTSYYFQAVSTSRAGVTTYYPSSPPLLSVGTCVENSFVVEAPQVILDLSGLTGEGRLMILTHTNANSALAAIVGDGSGPTEVWFNLGELFLLGGLQNFTPTGSQEFTARLYERGSGPDGKLVQEFVLEFKGAFDTAKTTFSPVALSVGSTIALTGERAHVDLRLETTAGASAVRGDFLIADRCLSEYALEPLASEIEDAVLTRSSPGVWHFELNTRNGALLTGKKDIARLHFVAEPQAMSAFVHIQPVSVQVLGGNGSPVGTVLAKSGRVVVIGEAPIIELVHSPGDNRDVVVYSRPFGTCRIELTAGLEPANWGSVLQFQLTNVANLVRLPLGPEMAFYRAIRYSEVGPFLEMRLDTTGRPSLLVHGETGSSYMMQYATNLSPVIRWTDYGVLELTNAVTSVRDLPEAGYSTFYRLKIR